MKKPNAPVSGLYEPQETFYTPQQPYLMDDEARLPTFDGLEEEPEPLATREEINQMGLVVAYYEVLNKIRR